MWIFEKSIDLYSFFKLKIFLLNSLFLYSYLEYKIKYILKTTSYLLAQTLYKISGYLNFLTTQNVINI